MKSVLSEVKNKERKECSNDNCKERVKYNKYDTTQSTYMRYMRSESDKELRKTDKEFKEFMLDMIR